MLKQSIQSLTGFVACGVLAAGANATIVTSVTTDAPEDAIFGSLQSITTADGTFDNLLFSEASNPGGSSILQSGDAPDDALPASVTAALSDDRIDTGTLGSGNALFTVSPTTADDLLFIFFNAANSAGFYQGPGVVTALDAEGETLGTVDLTDTTNIGDELGAFQLGFLAGRLLVGTTVAISEFAIDDVSAIAGFTVLGEEELGEAPTNFDLHAVGVAVVPEPASLGLLGAGAMCLLGSRRRK